MAETISKEAMEAIRRPYEVAVGIAFSVTWNLLGAIGIGFAVAAPMGVMWFVVSLFTSIGLISHLLRWGR